MFERIPCLRGLRATNQAAALAAAATSVADCSDLKHSNPIKNEIAETVTT
jgi:hypothetical protein